MAKEKFERYDEVPPNLAGQSVVHRAGVPVPA